MKKKNTKKKGFTLIELIVVIAILGILAAILVPKFSGYTSSAKKTACEAEARTVLSGLTTMYANDSTSVTTSTDQTDTNLVKLTGTLNGTLAVTAVSADGDISFTYTIGTHITTVTNGKIVSTT